MALGELASAVTGGNKVSSEKISKTGFQFKFQTLRESLEDLLR
jgi:NAD dependent epimerase/dehydratase family enzyme